MSKSGTEIKYLDYEKDIVRCNLCNKPMNYIDYQKHYGRGLIIEFLENKSIEIWANKTRYELEKYDDITIYKLRNKYLGEEYEN